MQCNNYPINISPACQSSPIVTVISAPNTDVQKLACEVSNVVTESNETLHSLQSNSMINEQPSAFESFVSEVLGNQSIHNIQTVKNDNDGIAGNEDDLKQ